MTAFVDANVWMFAVGEAHPLRATARGLLRDAVGVEALVVSAEVVQELLHRYLRAGRPEALDRALALVAGRAEVLPLEPEDVFAARDLAVVHPELSARDLVHLSFCQRRSVDRLLTFDRALAAASG